MLICHSPQLSLTSPQNEQKKTAPQKNFEKNINFAPKQPIRWCKRGANGKKKNPPRIASERIFVPRAGVEPARIAPLVFETSASTDSAIWAWCLGRFEAPLTETEVVDLLVLSLQRYCNLAKYQILFSDACLAS